MERLANALDVEVSELIGRREQPGTGDTTQVVLPPPSSAVRHGPLTFGEKMCALMAERGISQRKLSKAIHYDAGYLSKVSRNLKPPSAELAERLDTALDADGELAALKPPARRIQRSNSDLLTAIVGETGSVEDGDMERRLLLQLAALGLGAGMLGSSGESLRRLVDLALTSEPRTIEDWELLCADHLYAIRTRTPAQVREEMLLDLLTVQRQIQAPGAEDVTELHRVMAALSTLHANVLTRLGDHGPALRWWRTARQAADTSGDLDLRLLVRGEEAGFGLYGQRDPLTVLDTSPRRHGRSRATSPPLASRTS